MFYLTFLSKFYEIFLRYVVLIKLQNMFIIIKCLLKSKNNLFAIYLDVFLVRNNDSTCVFSFKNHNILHMKNM